MRVRVLGCSGAIAQGCRTTSFLVDQDLLIDAGTGVGDLTREEMTRIDDIFLTHAHLDHVAHLPLMVDTVAGARLGRPVRVHALPATLQALRQHLFNDLIWPDFTRLPTPESPLLTFHALEVGATRLVKGRTIEALPAEHAIPALGYALRGPEADAAWWVFSGDTERNPRFWQRVNQLQVHSLVIETAFSNREQDLARLSMHLSPRVLAEELQNIPPDQRYPIYITHTKPSETKTIMREISQQFEASPPGATRLDVRWLTDGHIFEL